MLHPRKAEFRYPAGTCSRIALLVPCFRETRRDRIFWGGWSEAARKYQPEVIVGTHAQLRLLTAVATPSRATVVLTDPADPLLTAEERERLWQAFHVPVFEQIVGEDGELLASECEAHDGLHLYKISLERPDLVLDLAPCGCGQLSPRLIAGTPADSSLSAGAGTP